MPNDIGPATAVVTYRRRRGTRTGEMRIGCMLADTEQTIRDHCELFHPGCEVLDVAIMPATWRMITPSE